MFVNNSSNTYCDGDERIDLPAGSSECVYEWIVFSGFIIWEFVVAVGELNELYDMWQDKP